MTGAWPKNRNGPSRFLEESDLGESGWIDAEGAQGFVAGSPSRLYGRSAVARRHQGPEVVQDNASGGALRPRSL